MKTNDDNSQAMNLSEEYWKFALEAAGDGVWDYNFQTGKNSCSRLMKEMVGFDMSLPDADIYLNDWTERLHPDSQVETMKVFQKVLDKETDGYAVEQQVRCEDGQYKWFLTRGKVVSRAEDGSPIRMIGTAADLTERKKIEEEMMLYKFVLEHAPINITFLDSEARIRYANKTACNTLGYTKEELQQLSIPDIDPLFPMEVWEKHWQSLKKAKSIPVETEHQRKNGERFPIEVIANYIEFGDKAYNIAFDRDITERKKIEEKMKSMAYYDHLTGLPNRVLFFDRLKQAMANLKRSQKCAAVFLLDLDCFKPINDNLGHEFGDKVLVQLAKRLKKCVRATDTVARYGGDEFGIVLSEVDTKDSAINIAEKILSSIGEPVTLNDAQYSLGVSIGIYMLSAEDKITKSIIHKADMAMYQAKEAGGFCWRMYEL